MQAGFEPRSLISTSNDFTNSAKLEKLEEEISFTSKEEEDGTRVKTKPF